MKISLTQKQKSISNFMLWSVVIPLMLILQVRVASSQTVLLSPTGDGGFETGASFALNNWINVSDGNNKWYVGTVSTAVNAGARAVYIDKNTTAGTTNTYNINQARVSHFYRDLTIPTGATNIALSFNWKVNGESCCDFLKVYVVPTSTTPVGGTELTSGQVGATYNNVTTWQTASITLSNSLAGTTQRLVFTWKNDGSLGTDPPAAVDNISVTYTAAAVCSGTPTPGTTASTLTSVCSAQSFTLSLTGATVASGITYQWQSSPNNTTYSNIGGATAATYATTQSSSTYYRCVVSCSGNSANSTPLQVTQSPFYNCYCSPSYTNSCSIDYISNVSFNGISNSTTCSGSTPSNLTTYNTPNPTITGGSTYPLSVTTGGDVEGINVWIDYNQNGTFDASESVLSGFANTNPATYTANVTVPLTVLAGQTKMRVRCQYNAAVTDPCVNYTYGETEDYLVTLAAAPPCITPPVGGTASGPSNACLNGAVAYSVSGGSGSYQWQSSNTAVSGPFTDISGATSSSFNYTASQTGTVYLRVKRSAPGCIDDFSNVLTISVSPGVDVSASASAASVCSGASVNLNATGALSYKNSDDYPIPDNNGLTNGTVDIPLVVSGFSPATIGPNTVKSVNFNINHTFVGDLRIRLKTPGGTFVTMVEQAGGSGVNFVNTTIVSSGGANGNIASGVAPFTGVYNSQNVLTGLTGNTNGTWGLRIVDLAAGDAGTLLDWTLTLVTDNGVAYTWTSNPVGFTSAVQNPTATPSVNTIYSVTGSVGSCNSSPSTVAVNINPLPVAVAGSNSPVCEGTSLSLTSDNTAQPSGNTYTWSGPNGFISASQNPTVTGSAALSDGGSYAVVVTNSFNCSASTSTNVIVNTNPVMTVVTNGESCAGLCDGDATISVTGGQSPFLFYDGINFSNDGIYVDEYCSGPQSVDVYDDNGCTSTATFNIGFISDVPVIAACPADIEQCTNVAAWSTPTASYGGVVTCSPESGSTFALGTTSVTCTATNSCGSSTCSFNVTINEGPVIGACPSDITQCDNHVATWADPTASGTPAPTVVCSPASGSTFAPGTTLVTCTATNSCGSSSCSFNVTINETPVIGACPSNISTCNPVVTFSTPSATGTPTATVVCSPASGSTFSLGTTSVTCTATNSCGSSSCSFDVTVNPLPTAVLSLSGSSQLCSGGSSSVSVSFTGTGPWTYTITGSGGPYTGTTSSNPVNVIITPVASGNQTYSVTSISDVNCSGSASGTATVTVSTAPPATSLFIPAGSYPASGCVGNVVNVICNTVPNATQYTWSVNAGTLINGQPGPVTTTTPNATLTLGAIAPNVSNWEICVFASNGCGVTNTKCFSIRGNLSTPAPIAGSPVACPSTSVTYSIPAVGGAEGYLWTGTNGITFTGSGTTVTANFPAGFTTGTICVSGTLTCGYVGPQRCLTVTNSSPNLGQMNGPFALCPGSINQVFSVPAAAGAASYTWSVPANISIVSGQGTPTLTVNAGAGFTQGQICVYATSNCGIQTAPRCKTMFSTAPLTPGNISGATTGVCGQTISYSVPSVSGVSNYTWSIPAGASFASPNGSNSIDVTYSGSFTTGQVCVVATNGCGNSPSRCVTVKGAPADPGNISGPVSVCANEQGTVYSISSVSGASSYVWTVPAGATIITGQGTTSILVDWGTSAGTVTVRATNECGTSGTKLINVSVGCKLSSGSLPGIELNAYPNPVRNVLNIELNSDKSGVYTVALTDLAGRTIYQKQLNVVNGINKSSIDVSQFNSGMYMLSVTSSDGFVKQLRIGIE